MSRNMPPLDDLFADCERSAVHLEVRDSYLIPGEQQQLAAWRAGTLSTEDRAARWNDYLELTATTVARGVEIRRLRIVSEPVSEYIAYEHAGTAATVKAGELVRWLGRAQARDLLLPVNDFWIFDERLIRWAFFAGDGSVASRLVEDAPDLARRLLDAFEPAWERAVPHTEYAVA